MSDREKRKQEREASPPVSVQREKKKKGPPLVKKVVEPETTNTVVAVDESGVSATLEETTQVEGPSETAQQVDPIEAPLLGVEPVLQEESFGDDDAVPGVPMHFGGGEASVPLPDVIEAPLVGDEPVLQEESTGDDAVSEGPMQDGQDEASAPLPIEAPLLGDESEKGTEPSVQEETPGIFENGPDAESEAPMQVGGDEAPVPLPTEATLVDVEPEKDVVLDATTVEVETEPAPVLEAPMQVGGDEAPVAEPQVIEATLLEIEPENGDDSDFQEVVEIFPARAEEADEPPVRQRPRVVLEARSQRSYADQHFIEVLRDQFTGFASLQVVDPLKRLREAVAQSRQVRNSILFSEKPLT
jgi:hypothetical protein